MRRWPAKMVCLCVLPAIPLAAADGLSQSPPAANRTGGTEIAKPKSMPPGVTPEREAAVMTFVRQHHPEIAELLVHLKGNRPGEYQRAVRDLFRVSERLAQIQERDSDRYELELELWKNQSRIQLLAARFQMARSEEIREQLQAALGEQIRLRRAVLQRDRERVTERLQKLDEQLERLEMTQQQEVQRQMRLLTQEPAAAVSKNRPAREKSLPQKGAAASGKSSRP